MYELRKVLVLMPTDEEDRALLEDSGCNCRFVYCEEEEPTKEMMLDANAIIGNPPPQFLKDCRKLEWVQLNSAGVGGYIEEGVLPKNTVLTNATGAYGLAISEHMTGVALMLLKKLHLYRDNQQKQLWKDEGEVIAVEGSTTLVVGLGDIGGDFARRMKAMGSFIIGIKRVMGPKPDYLDRLCTLEELDDVLPLADIVALSLPETSKTNGLFGKERFDRMKKGAILINVGRGTVLNTQELCDALESGHLSGAGLDVTDPEPLPPEHRIWQIPGAFITPHVSGGYHLLQTRKRIIAFSARNLTALIQGRPFENIVDFNTGYKRSE